MTDLFSYYDLQPADRPFWQYHQDNPHIYEMFIRFSKQIIERGFDNSSAKLVLERIRWETMTDSRFEPLKINNNYTAGYARMFMKDYPAFDGFFRTRELKSSRNQMEA